MGYPAEAAILIQFPYTPHTTSIDTSKTVFFHLEGRDGLQIPFRERGTII
jgi:hypothetical protein